MSPGLSIRLMSTLQLLGLEAKALKIDLRGASAQSPFSGGTASGCNLLAMALRCSSLMSPQAGWILWCKDGLSSWSLKKNSVGKQYWCHLGFLVLQMIGNTGDKFSWVGNLSLYNLFQPDKLIEGASSAYLGMAAFVIIAAVLYGSSIAIFNKRDLHI